MDEKYDQAALNLFKKEILNYVKQFFNEMDKVNLALVKSLKEQILKAKYIFYAKRWKRKHIENALPLSRILSLGNGFILL